jgi:hypothetical protein
MAKLTHTHTCHLEEKVRLTLRILKIMDFRKDGKRHGTGETEEP